MAVILPSAVSMFMGVQRNTMLAPQDQPPELMKIEPPTILDHDKSIVHLMIVHSAVHKQGGASGHILR